MELCFDEMCRKEVIDMTSGERLGYIDDIRLDIISGSVRSLVIFGGARLFGLLGRVEDTVLTCDQIRVVGDDVILVERTENTAETKFTKKNEKPLSSLLK